MLVRVERNYGAKQSDLAVKFLTEVEFKGSIHHSSLNTFVSSHHNVKICICHLLLKPGKEIDKRCKALYNTVI
jgi:hypothetical protein